jgi:hypothetical protein
MQKTHVYIAHVLIAVEAGSEAEACDAISESLRSCMIKHPAFIDWQYAKDASGTLSLPVDAGLKEIEEEGDAFK